MIAKEDIDRRKHVGHEGRHRRHLTTKEGIDRSEQNMLIMKGSTEGN